MGAAPCQKETPALQWLSSQLAGRFRAAFLREALADDAWLTQVDLDLMVFGDVPGFRPERRFAPDGTAIDLAWYPAAWLSQPERLAAAGLAAHRLKSARLLWDVGGDALSCRRAFDHRLYQPAVQRQRIEVLLDIGHLTVREIGVTWDEPPLARFWLQMAHASCLAALADASQLGCPNIFTRPFAHLPAIEQACGAPLRAPMVETLGLDSDPAEAEAAVRALHGWVSERYAQPRWPDAMRDVTRAEYAYHLSAEELAWRLAVAREMVTQGQPEAAVYYLRFWAYALVRLAMVWHRAAEGQDIAFLRPEQPVRPDLARHSPDLLPLLSTALGGPLDLRELQTALDRLLSLHRFCQAFLASRGLALAPARPWQPHREAPPPPDP